MTIYIYSWPPRELWPNRAKAGPGWGPGAYLGRQAAKKREYELEVYLAAQVVMRRVGWEAPERVRLTVTVLATDKRRRDDFNILAAFKCGIDTMVKAGALREDGPACVAVTVLRHEQHPSINGLRVEIEEYLEGGEGDAQ